MDSQEVETYRYHFYILFEEVIKPEGLLNKRKVFFSNASKQQQRNLKLTQIFPYIRYFPPILLPPSVH